MITPTSTATPIKPENIRVEKIKKIPGEVFEAFNEVLVRNMVTPNSKVSIRQDEVIALIQEKLVCSWGDIDAGKWLNIEEAYRLYGWDVTYDKPGYNETYPATYTFTPRPSNKRICYP